MSNKEGRRPTRGLYSLSIITVHHVCATLNYNKCMCNDAAVGMSYNYIHKYIKQWLILLNLLLL